MEVLLCYLPYANYENICCPFFAWTVFLFQILWSNDALEE